MAVPAVGQPAPDFTIDTTAGEKFTLAAKRGEGAVLLAFFPLAFTSTCTTEVCDFSAEYDAFAEQGVHVLPLSVDAVPSLKEFRRKHDLRVHLGSDMKRDASRAYGVLRPEYVSERAYFLVDREGTLRWAHVESSPGHRRTNGEVLAEIAKL